MSEGKSYPVQQMPPQQDPPPPYQTGPQQPPPVVVTTQPVPMYTNPARMFRDVPVPVKCMYCSADIVTATSFETGMLDMACLWNDSIDWTWNSTSMAWMLFHTVLYPFSKRRYTYMSKL
ncbi:hypothetical protein KUTeg_011561 [Tegillarca granosa]|uniref:LITAF domain-containing protein n=1 Tax=Tegillarca granosa TaxID=220873 RepID=A0ABQ9EWY7_TEGGR|nr:hypothetical protein KUTeg_011561 [Tegillarca granosa]